MKRDFQAKFLMHLNSNKKAEEGFTLIELLVVIIIIGILAAIALPSLLGQANKAKQAEARQNVGTMNRTQQSYILENGEFASTVPLLAVGIATQTENYEYNIKLNGASATQAGTANQIGFARKPTLKHYWGLMGTIQGDSATGEVLTVGVVCETLKPKSAAGIANKDVNYAGNGSACPATDWKNLAG